ncbi:MAG: ATP-dependent zinc protease [Planctomycetaceae bacterium]|nr:ATP-dependent zinc protease [Planctomycetaceae bacterium]
MPAKKSSKLPVIGWREWVAFPQLGVGPIKAKIDTGARSSSLHAFDMVTTVRDGKTYIRFQVHPIQRSRAGVVEVEAEVLEYRRVRSSSGQAARRPVIVTVMEVLGESWPIELTLANRDQMGFRVLLGREAFRGRLLVDAGRSYYGGRLKGKKRRELPASPDGDKKIPGSKRSGKAGT